jgi:tetratricopeptide (TPR) repeat protein
LNATTPSPSRLADRRFTLSPYLAGLIILAATLLAYADSFKGGFIFDDVGTIRDNSTIRQLWPIWKAWSAPAGQGLTSNGRPLVNLSLAVNYAIGGNTVRSYHGFNLLVHALAGLTLFGVVRRTLRRSQSRGSAGPAAAKNWAAPLAWVDPTLFALAIGLLWAVHPLLTESVTYIVQRAESMMGLFYLLTVYGFVRYAGGESSGAEAEKPVSRKRWAVFSVLACLLGMACKEVMVSAPVLVLLFDRTFFSGTFREAWRRHRGYFLALAGTWLLVGYEFAITGNRHGTAGFGTKVQSWPYALTQFIAICRYLRTAVWPHPLVFDYGVELVTAPAQVLPCALAVLTLLVATGVALVRRPAVGFLGVWFFAILAPTTSFIPVATQVMAEHRMYLPLAAVITLIVAAAAAVLGRWRPGPRQWVGAALVIAAAVGLGLTTARRNLDYRSDYSVWSTAIAGYPNNPRSHSNLGYVLAADGRLPEAMAEYREALRIHPYFADAQNNLGAAYFQLGDLPASITHYREALRIDPKMAGAHYNLGNSLVRVGQVDEGLSEFQVSLQLDPNSPEAHYNFATSLVQIGRLDEAIPEYLAALAIRPDYTDARNNLATAYLQLGRTDDAVAQYRQALAADGDSATAHFNLANILVQRGQLDEALTHYRRALAIDPKYAKAHCNLGSALVQLNRFTEAEAEYREALRINPRLAEARDNLARVEAYLRANP